MINHQLIISFTYQPSIDCLKVDKSFFNN